MDEDKMKCFYDNVKPHLNEKSRRLVVAGVALAEGRGGISKLSRATGMAREVIRNGIHEIEAGDVKEIEFKNHQRGFARKEVEGKR